MPQVALAAASFTTTAATTAMAATAAKAAMVSRPPDPGLFKRLISTFVPISKMF